MPTATNSSLDFEQLKTRWGIVPAGEIAEEHERQGRKRYLIQGLLPQRHLAVLIGDSRLGKSPLCYQMAICVAAGVPFLGHEVEQGRVLLVDFENGAEDVENTIERVTEHLGLKERPKDLLIRPSWALGNLQLEEIVAEICPSLVILDTLTTYAPEIEERNMNATRIYKDLRSLGCTILGTHHIRKPSTLSGVSPPNLETTADLNQWFLQTRGPGALINGADVRLGLERPSSRGLARDEIALVLRGWMRVRGEIPPIYLARACDEEGEPKGYYALTGASLLPKEQQEAFSALPQTFRFKDAKHAYGKGDQATADLLKKCESLGILRKANGGYEKIKVAESAE
jgi:hypothetical protein